MFSPDNFHSTRGQIHCSGKVLVFLSLIFISSIYNASAQQIPPTSGEDRIKRVLQTLEPSNSLRGALELGHRGDGVHYPWMDSMRQFGVKQVAFEIGFRMNAETQDLKIKNIRYLRRYYWFDNFASASTVEQIRGSGLEAILSAEISSRARLKVINYAHEDLTSEICGTLYLSLLDDELLPILNGMTQLEDCKREAASTRERPLVQLTNKRINSTLPSRLHAAVVDEETYYKVLDLVFPRNVLQDQKSDYTFVLRYEPAFRAESQITITGRGGNIEVVKYTALDGSIEARLSDMVRRGRKEDVRRMARLIRIQKQYINVSSQDIKRFHESFFDSLRLSERAHLDAAKDRVTITANGTGYRLWYSGQTEVQSEFGGSNITTHTRPDESPLLDWMKGVYLKVAASEIAHR